MSVSTNGQIWFGFDFEENEEPFKEAIKAYVIKNNIEVDKIFGCSIEAYDLEDLFDLIPEDINKGIEVRRHCSVEYPMWVMCIKKSYKFSLRGYSNKDISIIYETSPSERLDWKIMITNLCKKIGFEINPDEIHWHLSSMWC